MSDHTSDSLSEQVRRQRECADNPQYEVSAIQLSQLREAAGVELSETDCAELLLYARLSRGARDMPKKRDWDAAQNVVSCTNALREALQAAAREDAPWELRRLGDLDVTVLDRLERQAQRSVDLCASRIPPHRHKNRNLRVLAKLALLTYHRAGGPAMVGAYPDNYRAGGWEGPVLSLVRTALCIVGGKIPSGASITSAIREAASEGKKKA